MACFIIRSKLIASKDAIRFLINVLAAMDDPDHHQYPRAENNLGPQPIKNHGKDEDERLENFAPKVFRVGDPDSAHPASEEETSKNVISNQGIDCHRESNH